MLPVFDHLGFFVLYLVIDALAVPIASTVYVAYMGERHHPLVVGALGALGTTLGSVGQYLAVRWLLDHPALQRAWLTRLRERVVAAVGSARQATFWALFVIYATPLGAGPLRLVAAAGGYPLGRFAAAIALGCLPYYTAVAILGRAVRLPAWAYAAVIGVTIAVTAGLAWRRLGARPPGPAGEGPA